jgi:LCP family protein required for cell wall assembly
VLSLLWPGLGLISIGDRRGVRLAGAAAVAAAATLWWFELRTGGRVGSWVVRRSDLLAAIAISLGWLVFRSVVALVAMEAANRVFARPVERHSPAAVVAVIAVLTAIAAPHLLVVRYAVNQLTLLSTVFADERPEVALPTPVGGDVDAAAAQTGDDQMATIADLTAGSDTEAPSAGDADRARPGPGSERLNIVLLGGDGGYDRVGVRTDTIIVLSIDVESSTAAAFSIPRNWGRVPFPEGTRADDAFPRGFDDLANGIYGLGSERPELFPGSADPAGVAIKQAMAQLLGIPIHYYVLVEMAAVVETIDLFGGIDVTVDEYIDDAIGPIERGGPPLVIETEPGEHHFDGLTTLAYVRSRLQSSDYQRMARQRCVLGALIDQVSPYDVLRRYDGLSDVIADHVTTDIPLDDLPALIEVADGLDAASVTSIAFVPPDYPAGRAPTTLVRDEVERTLRPALAPVARAPSEPGEPLAVACNDTST